MAMGMLRSIQWASLALSLQARVKIEDVITTLLPRSFYERGLELVCRCWHHDPDRHPSCRVNPAKHLFFCDTCRHGGDVFRVVRDALNCSFSDAVRWVNRNADNLVSAVVKECTPPAQTYISGATPSRPTAQYLVYTYRDERDRVLYQKVRTPTKAFFYRRPVGNAEWVWNIAGIRKVLYGMQLLQLCSWILIVEGEKDAQSLWRLGLPATTNPEGAGPGKWRRAYSIQLRKAGIRHAYVIPDNDAVGRRHAIEIVASCRALGIKARLLKLPNLPPKGDVSDYLAAGHSRSDLLHLIRRTGESR